VFIARAITAIVAACVIAAGLTLTLAAGRLGDPASDRSVPIASGSPVAVIEASSAPSPQSGPAARRPPAATHVATGTPSSVGVVAVTGPVPSVAAPSGSTLGLVPIAATSVRVVSHGSRLHKVVALTFDDGYSAVATLQILHILVADKVPATFFPYGWAVHATSPAWHAVVRAGFPIGNHTLSHADLAILPPAQVTSQLVLGREAIDAYSGGTSVNLMRPPYGAYTQADLPAIAAAGYGTVVLWDVDTLDWTGNSVSTIVARATRGTNGSIVLMHAGPANTPQALPAIIAWYRAHGFTFVTVPELLNLAAH
jgi:peptidoglycan/xylan/chitin deacetylase (PgdA/CDA1 family)